MYHSIFQCILDNLESVVLYFVPVVHLAICWDVGGERAK